jgi:predicted flap endonuclease-1-like 5' DNA nuclease
MSRPLGKDEQQAHVTETGAAAAGLELSGPPVEVKAAGFPPAPSAPDDLKIIEGIGPKISGVLQAAGISTFAQLAAADTGRIRQILEQANPNLLRLADPATWPEQAALAAAGKMEDLRALQDGLKGGRER